MSPIPRSATTTVPTASALLADLRAKGSEATRRIWARRGIKGEILSARLGDVRALARKLETRHESYTAKAIAAGERLGRWDDRPVPKGCTSSYPPEWIPAAIALRNRRKG